MIIIIIIIYIGEPRPFIVIGKEEKKYLKKTSAMNVDGTKKGRYF